MSVTIPERTTLRPLADKVVVRVETERSTASGIVIPDTANTSQTQGTIVAVGPGKRTDAGETISIPVQEGDTIVYSPYGGTRVDINGEELIVLSESDILAVVEGGN